MGNKIGIDVGGTFTDVVLINQDHVLKKGKIPTNQDDLLSTVLSALDDIRLSEIDFIEHITVSTTLITNAILQKRLPDVELILFPGSGMRLSALKWPVEFRVLSGELDYRGRTVGALQPTEWQQLAEDLKASNTKSVAIISKFSHRNNTFEEQLAAYLKNEVPDLKIALGSQWGKPISFAGV
jgi:N-methylhydantoinase A/oxoprolinase/acetone carboxylase beta subunit